MWTVPPGIPVEFALLPFLLWGALRLALVGAATAGFVIAAIATSATVTGRIREVMRLEDIKARQGGDEFGIVQTDLPDPDSARLACQRQVERLNQPFEHDGLTLRPRTSIGVALFPKNGDNSETLFVAADQAMYRAKEKEASDPVFYSPEIGAEARG